MVKENLHLSGMYKNWFLEYASYVILERAVPYIEDGLKPVQRRILHSMKKLNDGRFNKVANIIGNTMQYHPHGDISINDALVQLGQKNLLIETQGNWGNIFTGDRSAAARYIEARLSNFALDVVFNSKTTLWKDTYDGRNKEPITMPVKFPLLLAQGSEGIAVGLATKILPHNFNELIDASISILKNENFEILPDFKTYATADFSKYNKGLRGGKVKVRAKITKINEKILKISEIPYGKTTSNLIESIVNANQKGKIKIKKIEDNTAENVEILIKLNAGISADKTIDAMFAFTDCEISISPNSCIIQNKKPIFIGVDEILKINTENTKKLLQKELEINLNELENSWHWCIIEKIFIENKIYEKIENCETWKEIIETIAKNLEKFEDKFTQKISRENIIKLTEIKIKRISKYDFKKSEKEIKKIEREIKKLKFFLKNIINYTINFFQNIKNKYGNDKKRRTKIGNFDTIIASKVVIANKKLYINKKEGFIGTSLKNDEFICECSDIDDIIVFKKDGTYLVSKISNKAFFGKNIIYGNVFKKNDKRTIYNVIYRNGQYGFFYVKRFAVKSVTRDKIYNLTQGSKSSKIIYFTANPNGEAEIIKVILKPKGRITKLSIEYEFSKLFIKGRNAKGNILTKNDIFKISLKEKGISTLSDKKIFLDEITMRLNDDSIGKSLGNFGGNDKILEINFNGIFILHNFDLNNHFEKDNFLIEKFDENKIFSVVYFDANFNFYYLKRFKIENKTPLNKKNFFIDDNPNSKLILISDKKEFKFSLELKKDFNNKKIIIKSKDFINVKSYKAKGKRLTNFEIKKILEI
ncbi:MAG: DNA topoisomerase IV [Bacteroidetes bacterium 4572_128]|nr:MAG: DNA topoisomerase IV [Bacteroidetes bacterium 4572_128]